MKIKLGQATGRARARTGHVNVATLDVPADAALEISIHRVDTPTDNLQRAEEIASAELDVTGAFSFAGLAPGRYRLDVGVRGRVSAVPPGEPPLARRVLDVTDRDVPNAICERLEAAER